MVAQPFRNLVQRHEMNAGTAARDLQERVLAHADLTRDEPRGKPRSGDALGKRGRGDGVGHENDLRHKNDVVNIHHTNDVVAPRAGAQPAPMLDGDRLRDRLKEIAARKGIGIFEWTAKAGLANATIHNLMQGKSDSMRPKTLELMAKAVGMTLDELMADRLPAADAGQILEEIAAMRREHTDLLRQILEELRANGSRGTKRSA